MNAFRTTLALAFVGALNAATPEQIEFFEKNIRPVLAERCYACHSAETMAAAELRLDSREGLLKGGTRGAAIAPGSPDSSLLLRAVSYNDLDLQMPPDGKLPADQIGALRAWVEMGAPDPREEAAPTPPAETSGIDWDEARKFWSFQSIADPAPPVVEDADWPANAVDRFLLARLEAEGMTPAPEADKRTLIRRVTYDLTGLPPTLEEVSAFLDDDSPDAWKKLVERLLASPHYGERWARHWLDLVRFAETNGHEYDNNKLDAWRYRDYVVRAFNNDLPYDQFVREQIAGDLLDEPRLTPDGLRREAPIGPGFYWLWEVLNSPTDSAKARADQVDNQIDVLGKAVFGLTLACARCHDHKFDPLPTSDYYALAGVLHSTEMRERSIDAPEVVEEIQAKRDRLAEIDEQLRPILRRARRARVENLGARLLIDRWASGKDYFANNPAHPLYPLARLAEPSSEPFADRLEALKAEMREWVSKANPDHPMWAERGDVVIEDFSDGFDGWDIDGAAFGDQPVRSAPSDLVIDGRSATPQASSFSGADSFVGTLATRKFRVPKRDFLHVRLAGDKDDGGLRERAKLRVTLYADDHPSRVFAPNGSGRMEWETLPIVFEKERLGRLQIVDRSREGGIVVDRIVFSNSQTPPPISEAPEARILALLDRPDLTDAQDLAQAYVELAMELLAKDEPTPEDWALLDSIEGERGIREALERHAGADAAQAARLTEERKAVAQAVPESAFAMSSQDHDPRDIRLHQRGNHKNLGDEVPRGFLTVFAGPDQEPFRAGSGRLELAKWAVSERNPLTPRVIVNRIWKHHFGEGLVRTVDNFGQTGERPTHPELLDYLASRFVESGWSIKNLHRMILYSNAYRMDSRASDEARERDPDNKLLSHMPVRRLEAEAIRDALLSVAGTLDPAVGGPSVTPHISPHQDGRGKPKSGPLDGDRRRSLYINVRRNFLTPMFLAFDYPSPITTMGRRGVSAVPSQALILLNNELVNQQADLWALAELERYERADARIADMFERAYSRPPTEAETSKITAFLEQQAGRYEGADAEDPRVWRDLAHVLINSTEFIYVR